MFLRDVEDGPGAGVYAGIVKMMQSQDAAVPQILHLFKFKPEVAVHLSKLAETVMRGPSPLVPGMRELIASFTSKENHCPF